MNSFVSNNPVLVDTIRDLYYTALNKVLGSKFSIPCRVEVGDLENRPDHLPLEGRDLKIVQHTNTYYNLNDF